MFVCLQDLSSAMKEVEGLTAQLRKQQQQSQQTAQELEQLRKVHTLTHTHTDTLCSSDAGVSEGLSGQATGLVMASRKLQQRFSHRKREQVQPRATKLLFLFH